MIIAFLSEMLIQNSSNPYQKHIHDFGTYDKNYILRFYNTYKKDPAVPDPSFISALTETPLQSAYDLRESAGLLRMLRNPSGACLPSSPPLR